MDPNKQMLEETLKISKENNRMLQSMRRNAFWGGIFKFIFYILILVVAPLWVYSTYLAPIVQQMQQTMGEVQGTGARAQANWTSMEKTIKDLGADLHLALQQQPTQ